MMQLPKKRREKSDADGAKAFCRLQLLHWAFLLLIFISVSVDVDFKGANTDN